MKRLAVLLLVMAMLAACAPPTPEKAVETVVVVVTATPAPEERPPEEVPPEERPSEEVPPVERPSEQVQIAFTADRTNLQLGECATLQWSVQGGFGVMLNGQSVERSGQTQVCPEETTPYLLGVDTGETIEQREVVMSVAGAAPPPPPAKPPATSPPPPPPPATPTATSPPPPPPPATPTGAPPPPPPSPTPKQPSPPTPTATPWTTDLAVTDLYPDKLKDGTVYGRITNHGPGTCKNVQIQFSCSWVKTTYGTITGTITATMPIGVNEQIGPKKITITSLNPGQTASFNTGITVDITQFWYDMTCQIHVGFNDPNTANNSYKEKLAK